MIRGIIHNNRPLISIIAGWKLGVQQMVVLLDTGFTGELKISPEKAQEMGLEITHTQRVSLGDDRVVNMSAALAVVSMEGVKSVVNVLISRGETIVGVSLLRRFGYILTADFRYNSLTLQK